MRFAPESLRSNAENLILPPRVFSALGPMRPRRSRLGLQRSVALGTAALMFGVFGSSGAFAQCTDNFNFFAFIAGKGNTPVSNLLPLGTGSSLSALTATINTVNTAFLTSTSAFVSAPGNPQPDQQSGGVWGRTIAGTVDTDTKSVGVLDTSRVNPPLAPATGRQHCDTTTRQDYWGYQVGHDIGVLNHAGSGENWHFGVTAGYLEARTKDITSGGTFTNGANAFITPPGSLVENTQVPFVGLYTAYTKGQLFVDGQVRWDFYQNSLSDPLNGLANQRLDADGISVTANAGYNIPLHHNWFIEPAIGIVWSHVRVDPLNVPGLVDGNGQHFARGSVTIDDIDSVLGRAGFSVGTSFSQGNVTWQPFFTASVFHEFEGDVTAHSLENDTLLNRNNNINGLMLTTTARGGVGTYGQFALGSAAVLGTTGWLGYGRVDYRIGDNIEGVSVNAGLRYQFTPEPGRGSIKDGPMPVAQAFNWTGPYIGAFAGMSWDHQDWSTPFGPPPAPVTHDHPTLSGALAGGEAGYNWQIGRVVVGVEGDYGFSNSRGGGSCDNAGGAVSGQVDFTCQGAIHELAALTGRLGHTWGRALFYAKGGLATGEVTVETKQNSNLPVPPSNRAVNGETQWQWGWALGAGMEFALTDRWSAKAEYMHYDLGTESFKVDSGLTARAQTEDNIVRVGINYHFAPRCCEAPLK
jgi:opacity protein-like surface antigen